MLVAPAGWATAHFFHFFSEKTRWEVKPAVGGGTRQKKSGGALGKYWNVRGMFPEGHTYFAFFIETERGRCAPRLRRKIYDAMTREAEPG